MSTSTAKQRSRLCGKGGPDGLDVQSIMNAIYNEFKVCCEINVYLDLAGDLLVECSGAIVVDGSTRQYFSSLRRHSPCSEGLTALMMQTAHELFHMIDRYVARSPLTR